MLEVFPSKLRYKEDYKAILADVTSEVYNIAFDFLKKTYLSYQQNDRRDNSPVEFYAIIKIIYEDFIKAADMIIARPHHILETTHEVLPGHKVRRVDSRGIRWIEKHPDHAMKCNDRILVDRALATKKQVTYDTKENCLTKYILQSTIKKLEHFKYQYTKLNRPKDKAVFDDIDRKIRDINRRINTSFLREVNTQEASAGLSLVFSMAPGYRDLYKHYLMLLRGMDITGDVFHISMKDLAQIYEYWCFIKLNSILKQRYKMVSQDIIKVYGTGLFINLVKGQSSSVRYRNPENGDSIVLSYNPTKIDMPTVAQKPDNVLSLRKRRLSAKESQYEYVFDAKYRINPAIPGTYYADNFGTPGPELGDINTMHRYRDAIVYQNGASPYERTMFGAYVLFPYANLEEFRKHHFYESIGKVNIGGLPFLPSATKMVEEILEDLISDSPESAFERTTLPVGIEEKLAEVDWSMKDVLIGNVHSQEDLDDILQQKQFTVPAHMIKDKDLPVHFLAIYQPKDDFQDRAGIYYYGLIRKSIAVNVPGNENNAIKNVIRYEIKEWHTLENPIKPRAFGQPHVRFTNLFLLKNVNEYPELFLQSEQEYRLYVNLKRIAKEAWIQESETDRGFKYNDSTIIIEGGQINLYQKDKGMVIIEKEISKFLKNPNDTMKRMREYLK